MESIDPYSRIAKLYDLEHDSFRSDVEMYQQFVQAAGDPVLEIGTGTGRIAVPLAEMGYQVTGTDPSVQMLDVARLRGADVADRCTFVEGDLFNAHSAPGGPFGVVILALDVMLHLDSSDAQREALGSIYRALDPRGQLIIDVFNPTPETLGHFDGSVTLEGSWQLERGKTVDKLSSRLLRHAAQMIDTTLWYEISEQGSDSLVCERIRTAYGQRYVTAAELELMLELAGFDEWILYGGYDLEPYEDSSERLIVAADVTRTP